MLHSKKNQFCKSKLKICGAVADMWLYSSLFCAENVTKVLKRAQEERWGLVFSHTQAQYGDESCCKIVGREGLPCCACMFQACCGPFSPMETFRPVFQSVFGSTGRPRVHWWAQGCATGARFGSVRPVCPRAPCTKNLGPLIL